MKKLLLIFLLALMPGMLAAEERMVVTADDGTIIDFDENGSRDKRLRIIIEDEDIGTVLIEENDDGEYVVTIIEPKRDIDPDDYDEVVIVVENDAPEEPEPVYVYDQPAPMPGYCHSWNDYNVWGDCYPTYGYNDWYVNDYFYGQPRPSGMVHQFSFGWVMPGFSFTTVVPVIVPPVFGSFIVLPRYYDDNLGYWVTNRYYDSWLDRHRWWVKHRSHLLRHNPWIHKLVPQPRRVYERPGDYRKVHRKPAPRERVVHSREYVRPENRTVRPTVERDTRPTRTISRPSRVRSPERRHTERRVRPSTTRELRTEPTVRTRRGHERTPQVRERELSTPVVRSDNAPRRVEPGRVAPRRLERPETRVTRTRSRTLDSTVKIPPRDTREQRRDQARTRTVRKLEPVKKERPKHRISRTSRSAAETKSRSRSRSSREYKRSSRSSSSRSARSRSSRSNGSSARSPRRGHRVERNRGSSSSGRDSRSRGSSSRRRR